MADTQQILKVAQTAIQEDPTISNPTSIVASVRRKGPIFRKKTVIQLDGSVGTAHEIDKVEQTIKRKLPAVEVENNLVPA